MLTSWILLGTVELSYTAFLNAKLDPEYWLTIPKGAYANPMFGVHVYERLLTVFRRV